MSAPGFSRGALIVSALLVLPALVWPGFLSPVYRVWMAIGYVLGWINTRIILGVVFFLLFTPMGLIMRLLGKDPMCRRFDPQLGSYRVLRSLRPKDHMLRQF